MEPRFSSINPSQAGSNDPFPGACRTYAVRGKGIPDGSTPTHLRGAYPGRIRRTTSPGNFERHMARLARDPLEPCADCRVGGKIESAVRRAVCVGIQRNVRDRVTPAREA